MLKSEQINELAKALAKAQADIEKARKSSKNPHYKSSYADLSDIIDACRDALSENGLSVSQWPDVIEGEKGLTSILMHTSGQWISSFFPFIIEKPTMQGMGSAITYAKRYALSAIVGIAETDDDGNEAEKYPAKPKQTAAPIVTPVKKPQPSKQAILYKELTEELGFNEKACKDFLMRYVNKDSFKTLTEDDLNVLFTEYEKLKKGLNSDANEDFEAYPAT